MRDIKSKIQLLNNFHFTYIYININNYKKNYFKI